MLGLCSIPGIASPHLYHNHTHGLSLRVVSSASIRCHIHGLESGAWGTLGTYGKDLNSGDPHVVSKGRKDLPEVLPGFFLGVRRYNPYHSPRSAMAVLQIPRYPQIPQRPPFLRNPHMAHMPNESSQIIPCACVSLIFMTFLRSL